MIRAHTVEQVRAAEAALMEGVPEGALMQRAAHGLAHAVLDLLRGDAPPRAAAVVGRHVLLLVGSGDNGGDALHAGVVLARRGVRVSAWLLSDHAHEAGLAALVAAGGRVVTAVPAAGSGRPDLVLDAVVGIGGRPGLREAAVAALAALDGVPVLAVDTPSGVDVDTGELDGPCVTAGATVTFGTHKVAHLVDPAAEHAGAVHLVDLGLELPPPALEALQPADVAALLPRPARQAQKYGRGVVGVRSGSAQYPGAALLSVGGADVGLTGMVRYVGDDAVATTVRAQHPEVVGPGRVQAWVVGSGGGADAGRHLAEALDDGVPVVVDADALAHLAEQQVTPAVAATLVLTPHAGELAALLDVPRDEVEARPLHHARLAVDRTGSTVLLKGRRTIVAAPDGRVRVNLTGTPWLATAGAGDVLGGLVAALLAAGLTPYDAASVGAWVHGAAATEASAGGPLVAGRVAQAIPAVLRDLLVDAAAP